LITSIPYGIEKDALVERIGELIAKGQVPQLTNVKDLSTDDIRILLELKAGANADAALAYLYKNTPLQINYSINLTCLLPADGAEVAVPARLDLKTILQQFLDFRLEIVTRRLQFELKNLLARIHILEGFAIVFNNLDEAITIIRNSDGKADAAPKLIARFELSELQADAVLETRLYRLGKLEIRDILEELAQKRERAKEIQQLLDDEPARWQIIRGELKQIAQTFGEPRRTRIKCRRPRSSSARKITSSTKTPGSLSRVTVGPSARSPLPMWRASACATTIGSAGFIERGRGKP
jgi:DNA gyrase subunit A